MPSLLAGLVALVVVWQFQFCLVLGQDDSNPNNITFCGSSDFYNSTELPYSCKFSWDCAKNYI